MRPDPGDYRIALRDDGAYLGGARARRGAVEAVDPAVAIAGLAAAFLLNRNPRLVFPHHSNPINPHPLPRCAAPLQGSYARAKAGG
jgi:hypothetical protein